MRKITWIALLTLFSVMFIAGCQSKAVTIEDEWARPAVEGGNTAAYMMIKNGTSEDAALVDVRSDIAMAVELHRSSMVDGVMKMEQQQSIPIAANSQTELMPGDYHVMIINVKKDLSPGDVFDLTLVFANSDEITLPITVQEP